MCAGEGGGGGERGADDGDFRERGERRREANGDGGEQAREAKDGVVRRETAKRAHGV